MQLIHYQHIAQQLNQKFQSLIPLEFEWLSYSQGMQPNIRKDKHCGNNIFTEYYYGLYQRVLYIVKTLRYTKISKQEHPALLDDTLTQDILWLDTTTHRVDFSNIKTVEIYFNELRIIQKDGQKPVFIFTTNPEYVTTLLFQNADIELIYKIKNEVFWKESLLDKTAIEQNYNWVGAGAKLMSQTTKNPLLVTYFAQLMVSFIVILVSAFVGLVLVIGTLTQLIPVLFIKVTEYHLGVFVISAFSKTTLYQIAVITKNSKTIREYKILDFQQLKQLNFNTIELIGQQQQVEIYTTEPAYFIQQFKEVHPTIQLI